MARAEDAALNPVEEALLEICSQALDTPALDITANFFDLGGTSISAIWLISQVRERFQVELPLAEVLSAPTLADLAVRVLQGQAETEDEDELAAMLDELDGLSDEEAQASLAEKVYNPFTKRRIRIKNLAGQELRRGKETQRC